MNLAALITLAAGVLAASGTAVGLALALVRSERRAAKLELDGGRAGDARDKLAAELARVQTAASADTASREKLISDLKRRLEVAHETPGAVRDDLRGMLGVLEEAGRARALATADVLPLRAAAELVGERTPPERPGGPR